MGTVPSRRIWASLQTTVNGCTSSELQHHQPDPHNPTAGREAEKSIETEELLADLAEQNHVASKSTLICQSSFPERFWYAMGWIWTGHGIEHK